MGARRYGISINQLALREGGGVGTRVHYEKHIILNASFWRTLQRYLENSPKKARALIG